MDLEKGDRYVRYAQIKPIDLQEIWQFDLSIFIVTVSVPKLRWFEIVRAINTFETASAVSYTYK